MLDEVDGGEAVEVALGVGTEFDGVLVGEEDNIRAGEVVPVAVAGGFGLSFFSCGAVRLGSIDFEAWFCLSVRIYLLPD